ncbi:MAG: Mov34/MPN/PAD-1 family protein [Candidatus Dadabacteria bacterium]|nr:Mov34/MPN/PAD-1 family protein [Candidatus Dadabacteria bacterium]
MKPRIVGEQRAAPVKGPPPQHIMVHPWLFREHRPELKKRAKESQPLDLYLALKVEERIRRQAKDSPDEIMGLLIGEVRVHRGNYCAVARDIATSKLDADSVHVQFDRAAMDGLAAALDSLPGDYIIVGWYHSHPGHGCFLSPTDIATQSSQFAEPYHVALVIDPVKEECAAFKVRGGEAKAAAWAMYME